MWLSDVDALPATAAVYQINEVQQLAQLVPVEKHDIGVSQNSLPYMDGSVVKPKTKGKNICQNHWHQDARAQSMVMFQGDKAKHQNCTIVHLLAHDKLDAMKNKGAITIHVTLPIKSAGAKEKTTFWLIVNISSQINGFAGLCKNNLLIVTTYDQLSSSNHIQFIGTASHKPMPKTWALLCLVWQQPDSKSLFDNDPTLSM